MKFFTDNRQATSSAIKIIAKNTLQKQFHKIQTNMVQMYERWTHVLNEKMPFHTSIGWNFEQNFEIGWTAQSRQHVTTNKKLNWTAFALDDFLCQKKNIRSCQFT